MKFKTFPLEFDVTSVAAGDELTKTVLGFNDEGLIGVLVDSIAQDAGVIAATATTKVSVKLVPKQQTGLFGGDTTHTFANLDSQKQTEIKFENAMLRPGEDMDVKVKPGVGATTVRIRVNRRLVYRDDAPVFAR